MQATCFLQKQLIGHLVIPLNSASRLDELGHRFDQSKMSKCLGEVAEMFTSRGVDLLGIEI